MLRVSDLRVRDVVNVVDGRRLGLIKDIDLDIHEGKVKALILPGLSRLWGLLGRSEDLVIPWEKVKKLGVDTILVELDVFTSPLHNE